MEHSPASQEVPNSLHCSYVKIPALDNSVSKMPSFEDTLKFTKRLFILETNNCLSLALDRSVASNPSWGLRGLF